ncbi:MAG: NTE family protein RssA [Elusimicrobia bacterium ADurb.Bin231]|nr:MAG: NTE family protein RssA [Elusimicrobia bacterium ADurb.Bin231]
MKKYTIGLALGGGGARGLAHIGVLKIFEEAGIIPDMLSGTSMGALIGSMFASGMKTNEIEKRCTDFLNSSIYKDLKFEHYSGEESENWLGKAIARLKQKALYYLSDLKIAFIEKSSVESIVSYFIPDIEFGKLKIPFACVAVDIAKGEEVIFKTGSLRQAVVSSMSIPGIMQPVKMDDKVLVDGGVLQMVPVTALRALGCEFAIAVDVSTKPDIMPYEKLTSAFEVSKRSSDIVYYKLDREQLANADYVLSPAVKSIKWFEIKRLKECALLGENETLKHINNIRIKSKKKQRASFVRRLFAK